MPTAEATYVELVELVELAQASSPVRIRVAVDGRDGAGKTTFADRLATVVRAMGHEVYRAGIDDWHLPAKVRYQRGRESAEGYYLDAFDFEGVTRSWLFARRHAPTAGSALENSGTRWCFSLGERSSTCWLITPAVPDGNHDEKRCLSNRLIGSLDAVESRERGECGVDAAGRANHRPQNGWSLLLS